MDFNELPPEERKRMLAALGQDRRYVRSRNVLLLASIGIAICLSGVGWLVLKNIMTLDASVVAICVCVATYLFFLVRVVRTKKATMARLMTQVSARKVNKKEKKKGRQNQ